MKITLGDFIEKMKSGWGFARPGNVMAIGRALDKLIPKEDRNQEVEVNFQTWTSGYGAGFHYHYRWYVAGYQIPENVSVKTSADALFGSVNKFICNTEQSFGFMCGYDW